MAKPLSGSDAHHLSAAEGWLELGNHLEANEELEKITAIYRVHPDVVAIRWHIYAKEQRWDVCVDLGRTLVSTAPDRPSSWVLYAQALYRLKRFQDALEALAPAYRRFTVEPAVVYDLACYNCLTGRIAEAKELLDRAFLIGGDELKLHALGDPDLEPLWREIQRG